MKLVSFLFSDKLHFGALLNSNRVVDLAEAYRVFQRDQQEDLSADLFPADLLTFLQQSERWWDITAKMINWLQEHQDDELGQITTRPLDQVKLAAPITNPSKIVCIGLNYHDHCRETNTPVPTEPVTFVKYPSAIIGPDDAITWSPDSSKEVDYEAELALVIKRRARNVPAAEAYQYIAGYTIVNDISARDVQFSEGQWVRAKSFDTFCPLGPCLVTTDDIPDPQQLAIRCRLNGDLVQDSNTSELIFDIPTLIAYITRNSTLLPGDIISTGTPHGTGAFRTPPIYLKPGDDVEVEIDHIGILRNGIT